MKCDKCYNNILKRGIVADSDYCLEYEAYFNNSETWPKDFDFEKCEKFVPKPKRTRVA